MLRTLSKGWPLAGCGAVQIRCISDRRAVVQLEGVQRSASSAGSTIGLRTALSGPRHSICSKMCAREYASVGPSRSLGGLANREPTLPSPISMHRVLDDGRQAWFEARAPFSEGLDISLYYSEELVTTVSAFILANPQAEASAASESIRVTARGSLSAGVGSAATAAPAWSAPALPAPAPHHLMLLGGTKSGKTKFAKEVLPRMLAAAYASPDWHAIRSSSDGDSESGSGRPRPVIISATLSSLCGLSSAGCLHSALIHSAATQGFRVMDQRRKGPKYEPRAPAPGEYGAAGWHLYDPAKERARQAFEVAAKAAAAEREIAGTIDTLPQLFLHVAQVVRAAGCEPWFIIDNIDEPLLSGSGSTPAEAARFGAKLAEVSQPAKCKCNAVVLCTVPCSCSCF